MGSSWQSTRASLDNSLVVPFESLEKLKAAKAADIAEAIKHVKAAAESAQILRSLISTESPEASWQHREELDTLIETIQKDIQARTLRSRLLALVSALERGSIVHRRAARVDQLKLLRDQAIRELRSLAEMEEVPPPLPGPEADQWVEWACGLKEPEDTESLRILQSSFLHLEAFVAHLEPGMWQVITGSEDSRQDEEKTKVYDEELQKNLRERLSALATELQRGSIVHHRASRVNQLNQLRDEAVNELRGQAEAEGVPATLPGPAADRWIEWACGLKEPDDAESLQIIRDGFAHLDAFVAHLEPNMWVAAASAVSEVPTELADKTQQTRSRLTTSGREEPVVSSGPLPSGSRATALSARGNQPPVSDSIGEASASAQSETLTPSYVAPLQIEEQKQERARLAGIKRSIAERLAKMMSLITDRFRDFKDRVKRPKSEEVFQTTGAESGISSDIGTTFKEISGGNRRILVITAAVVVLAVLGALGWRWWHRNRSGSSSVTATQTNPPELTQSSPQNSAPALTPSNLENKDSIQPGVSTNPAERNSSPTVQTEKEPKAKVINAAPTPAPTPPAPKQASNLDQGQLRTPARIPKTVATASNAPVPPPGATDLLGAVPGSATGVSNGTLHVAAGVPATTPTLAPQKVRVSSGVTEGQLVHRVTPVYPLAARQARIEGTVTLQAVIAKDGTVQSVQALNGHPMLIQAAVDAVKKWRYKPFYLNGQPVEAETQISIKFSP